MASTPETVTIRYCRLPGREDVYVQRLLHRDPSCIVTFMPRTPLKAPLRVDGSIILEDGSPVIWFTFPGEWHDIGRFHTADGRFTGIYSNVLTPVDMIDAITWRTTDLFLDVWLPEHGGVLVLDEDELEQAESAGSIGADLAGQARNVVQRLARRAAAGTWPPPVVGEWPLERVLREYGHRTGSGN